MDSHAPGRSVAAIVWRAIAVLLLAPVIALTLLSLAPGRWAGGTVLVSIVVATGVIWSRRSWLRWTAVVVLVCLGLAGLQVDARRSTQDKSVASYQLLAALDQFHLENPKRVFIAYDDIVGPERYVKAPWQVDGEDYREAFPIRVDDHELAVTLRHGRKVIVWNEGGLLKGANGIQGFREMPGGEVQPSETRLEVARYRQALAAVARYERWRATRRALDGVHREPAPGGGYFETIYRAGVRHGPFKAFHADGALWAEATYANGFPVGRHVLYARDGRIVYETSFPARGGRP